MRVPFNRILLSSSPSLTLPWFFIHQSQFGAAARKCYTKRNLSARPHFTPTSCWTMTSANCTLSTTPHNPPSFKATLSCHWRTGSAGLPNNDIDGSNWHNSRLHTRLPPSDHNRHWSHTTTRTRKLRLPWASPPALAPYPLLMYRPLPLGYYQV